MALSGRSFGSTARNTPGVVAGPFLDDMNVLIRLTGVAAMQRIGFTQDDVADGSGVDDRGFMLLSGEEVAFVLTAGDSLYANGSLLDAGNGPAAVLSILATKVV